jgi:hypothetical protein
MEPLNHVNPEYVTWKYEEINFALLGGIRIEGLQSMRVTLKVEFKNFQPIRHSLDLASVGLPSNSLSFFAAVGVH